MNYSDEEFYGNQQNTVDSQGEIKPIEEPKQPKKEFSVFKTVALTSLKTLLVVFGAIFYFMAVCHILSPLTAAKVYQVFGANNAVVICYENVYEKTGNLSDLYNLVQRTIEAGDSVKTNKYIEILQKDNNYGDFCKKVNDSTIKVSEKKYIAYVGDLDSYLVSQNIIALYQKGEKEKAKNLALKDLTSENIYSFGFSAYADCLASDTDYTIEQRGQMFVDLLETTYNQQYMMNYISQRLALVNNYKFEQVLSNKILKVYTALKIQNVRLNYFVQKGEETNADNVRIAIEKLQEDYDALIRS